MLSIIMPVHNEEMLSRAIWEIRRVLIGIKHEIIIIDDCSRFKVKDYYLKDVMVIRNEYNMGKGRSLLKGMRLATHEFVVFLDADLQIHPREIKTFLRIRDLYDADVVIGNKRHPYSQTNYTSFRWFVSNTYNLIIRILFGFLLRDTQCGLKLFRRSVLDMMPDIDRYAFDLELIVRLREKGCRIIDAPVNVYSTSGQGSVNIKSILRTFMDTIKIWYKKERGYYGR